MATKTKPPMLTPNKRILPCVCGRGYIRLRGILGGGSLVRVVCPSCGKEGGAFPTQAKAVQAWNRAVKPAPRRVANACGACHEVSNRMVHMGGITRRGGMWVECACGRLGDTRDTAAEAIKAWNADNPVRPPVKDKTTAAPPPTTPEWTDVVQPAPEMAVRDHLRVLDQRVTTALALLERTRRYMGDIAKDAEGEKARTDVVVAEVARLKQSATTCKCTLVPEPATPCPAPASHAVSLRGCSRYVCTRHRATVLDTAHALGVGGVDCNRLHPDEKVHCGWGRT